MHKNISTQDAWLAYEFAMLYHYAQNADQADDENQIKLVQLGRYNRSKEDAEETRKRNYDIVAVALKKGFTCYDDMPSGTKSFLSICAARAKKNKNAPRRITIPFLHIVKEEYARHTGEIYQLSLLD